MSDFPPEAMLRPVDNAKQGSSLTNGCAWNAMSAFANGGRAVAHVRGSYLPNKRHYSITSSSIAAISRPSAFAVLRLITQLVFGRLVKRISRIGTSKNLIDEVGDAAIDVFCGTSASPGWLTFGK